MKQYIAFTKKEFMEVMRNYKLLIMVAVFLILGLLSPLTAKIMPMIMTAIFPESMSLAFAEPTAIDSWVQFYKNVSQMGLIVLIILYSTVMSGEFSKSTLVNMLTKGLKRKTVILSKLTSAVCAWTVSFFMCFGVTYLYTIYFWHDKLSNIFLSAVCLWFFGVLLLCAVIFGGILFKNSYGSLLFTACFVGLQFIVGIIPNSEKYNPLALATKNIELLSGNAAISDMFLSLVVTMVVSILLIILSIIAFNKKSI